MRNRVFYLLCIPALLVVAVLLSAPEPAASEAAEPEITFQRDVTYGTGDGLPLTLNLAMPAKAEETLPAVLIFHGGGWTSGRKERHDNMVRYLAHEGYFAATVGYRLANPLKKLNFWPAQIEDAKCAVRWLRANAVKYGVDPDRIGCVGFSAGGHLAMLLGTMHGEDGCEGEGGCPEFSSRVKAVVSFFGPTDMGTITEDMDALRKQTMDEKVREARGRAIGMVLGPEFRKDPSRASPLTYVTSDDAPMLLIQGTRDRLVPYGDAKQMVDALTKAKVPGEVVFKIGLGHGWGDPHLTDSVDHTLRFLDRQLRPGLRKSVLPRLK